MRQRTPTIISLFAATWALGGAQVGASAAQPPAAPKRYSDSDIQHYASALFKVIAVKRMAEQRSSEASPAEQPLIEQQAEATIYAILSRHGFDQAEFNRFTAAVERRPALRRQVRELVLSERLGL